MTVDLPAADTLPAIRVPVVAAATAKTMTPADMAATRLAGGWSTVAGASGTGAGISWLG